MNKAKVPVIDYRRSASERAAFPSLGTISLGLVLVLLVMGVIWVFEVRVESLGLLLFICYAIAFLTSLGGTILGLCSAVYGRRQRPLGAAGLVIHAAVLIYLLREAMFS